MSVQYTCTFANPRLYDGSIPVNPGQQWQYINETCVYNNEMYAPTTTISSSTSIQFYGSFTAGELVVGVLMLIMLLLELAKSIASALSKVNTEREFLSYQKGEVEIRKD